MRPSELYAWDTKAMIPQNLVHCSGQNMLSTADVGCEVPGMATSPSDNDLETTDTAVQV